MSAVMISTVLKSGSGSLHFQSLFLRCRSWQCRSVCRLHSLSLCRSTGFVLQRTLHRPPAADIGLNYFCTMFARDQLLRLSFTVRWFSDNERERNDDGGNVGLKGYVFRVPNPRAWLKNKWYTYRINSLVDPFFSLREFHVGAKQVYIVFVVLSSLFMTAPAA